MQQQWNNIQNSFIMDILVKKLVITLLEAGKTLEKLETRLWIITIIRINCN